MIDARLCILAVLGIAALQPAWARQTQPPVVARELQEAAKLCAPDKLTLGPKAVRISDLNRDGRPDYVLDYAHILCGGSISSFCGSAGCLTTVFVSSPTGYRKVLDENVFRVRFTTLGGRPAMLVERGGSACGRTNAAGCPAEPVFLDASGSRSMLR